MDRLGKIKSHHLQPDSRMYLPQMLNCAAGVLATACCWHQGRTPPTVLRWMSLLCAFLPTCLLAALLACCARAPPLAAGRCVDRTWPGSWLACCARCSVQSAPRLLGARASLPRARAWYRWPQGSKRGRRRLLTLLADGRGKEHEGREGERK